MTSQSKFGIFKNLSTLINNNSKMDKILFSVTIKKVI